MAATRATSQRDVDRALPGGEWRARIVSLSLLSLFLLLAIRGGWVALNGADPVRGLAAADETSIRRADIVDRNGDLLATSVTVHSLFANPRAMMSPELVTDQLMQVLPDLDRERILSRLENKDRAFVWIKRGLTPRQRQDVFQLGLEGLDFREEQRRAYPRGSLAGHVLGFAGTDGQGLSGLEYGLDARLKEGGEPVQLTLDANVQFSLEAELVSAVEQYEAEAAAGIVMHAPTGEILAMASVPVLDPNRATRLDKDDPALRNRAIASVYELGSVFKPLTVAAALETGAISLRDRFDVAAPITIKGYTITDTHPVDSPANATAIVSDSSNIGTVRIAEQLGIPAQLALFQSLGFLERTEVELPGREAPFMLGEVDRLKAATSSYGHGIAMSPLTFAAGFNALASGGLWVAPTLVDTLDREPATRRVFSAETTQAAIDMLRHATTIGTGTRADSPGYRVAGKTGTAEKPVPGGYSATENICSFAAIFPADSPEYVVLIVLDAPKAGADRGRAASWNAAPTAGRVIGRIAPILGVEPKLESADQTTSLGQPASAERSAL